MLVGFRRVGRRGARGVAVGRKPDSLDPAGRVGCIVVVGDRRTVRAARTCGERLVSETRKEKPTGRPMKRLGTCAVLLSMIAAIVVSAGYLRSVRMQRVVPATVPPDERIFRARLLFAVKQFLFVSNTQFLLRLILIPL